MGDIVKINFEMAANFSNPAELIHRWQLLDIPRSLAKLGVKTTIIQLSDRNADYAEQDIQVQFVKAPAGWSRPFVRRLPVPALLNKVRESEPSVIHIEGLHYAFQIYWIKQILPSVPVFVQDHANKLAASRLRAELYRRIYRQVEGVLFSSKSLAQDFFENGYFPPELLVYEVFEGTTLFQPSNDLVEDDENFSPRIVSVGDLVENKDPITVLIAFKELLKSFPNAYLDFYFRRDFMKSEMTSLLNSSSELRARVNLRAAVKHDDLEHIFQNADYFVSASHREGGAYSLIEALACGVTPVVSDIPVHRRILKDGRVGYLFQNGDSNGLASALIRAEEVRRPGVREVNRAHFESYLSADVIARKLVEIYRLPHS